MTESKTGLSNLMEDLDLEDVNDTGYERDMDVEITDGFYYQNVPSMNDKIQLFADYWMKLYSHCCLQRDYAIELLNDNKPEEAKAVLQDWPDTFGSPHLPQLLVETPNEPKRNKRSPALNETVIPNAFVYGMWLSQAFFCLVIEFTIFKVITIIEFMLIMHHSCMYASHACMHLLFLFDNTTSLCL